MRGCFSITNIYYFVFSTRVRLKISVKHNICRRMIIPSKVLNLITALSESECLEYCIVLRNKDDDNNKTHFPQQCALRYI